MAPAVPKFASFRPKPRNASSTVDESEPSVRRSREGSPRRQSHSNKPSRDASPKRRRSGEHRTQRDSSALRSARDDDAPVDARPSSFFFSDRRGDRDILRYGSLNPRDVPDYRRSGHGHVLGLALDWKIDRERSSEKHIVLARSSRRPQERLLTRKLTGREQARALRFVGKSLETALDDHERDFIQFSTTRKRKRDDDDTDADEIELGFDYRGLQANNNQQPADPDAEYESDSVTDAVAAEVTARNAILVRRTKDHPDDLQPWLDLVEHQHEMMKMDQSSSELRKADKQHLAKVRISVFEQALKKGNHKEDAQVRLYMGLMSEGAMAWDEEQMARKWTEVLVKFPFSTDLWLIYLNWVESTFVSFRFEACKATFQKCLETMQLSVTAIDVNASLYVFRRLTAMMHQAGYQELALAAWQALLEYHLLSPDESSSSAEGGLQSFEEFWESEVPRIGEENAKGWQKAGPDDGPAPETEAIMLSGPTPTDTVWNDFGKRETDYASKLRKPGRTTDELGGDDAFHTILFSDIDVFLKLLPRTSEKIALVSAFLQFCNLPPLRRTELQAERYNLDPFLQANLDKTSSQEDGGDFPEVIAKYANCPIKNFQMTARLLFDSGFAETPGIVDIEFVRKALKLLHDAMPEEESIGEYLLALESRHFPEASFRTAKQLLKARPTSLRLYHAYGLAEARRNNPAKADQVFSAALSMQGGDTPLSTEGSLELLDSWCWEALGRGDAAEALWRLVSPAGKFERVFSTDGLPDQAALLRSQTMLNDICERALLASNFSRAALATSHIALLAYLIGGEKPEIALSAFSHLYKWFESHGLSQIPAAELHAQYVARFLTLHAQRAKILKPALIRETLEPFIAIFRDNTLLLSLYAANEARFAIDDRVRSIMHQQSKDQDRSIVSWTFAIHHEILRGEIAGSTSHSIRALFEKAEDGAGAHCPALWRQHVLFEIAEARKVREKRPRRRPRKDGKRSKEEIVIQKADERAKDTFFRGLTHLAWCKDYMMMAFTNLGEEFLTRDDLRKVYNVMVEKELRLYVEIDGAAA